MSIATILGWVGAISGGVLTWVQVRRSQLHGSEGVSPLTWSLFLFMGVFWVSYGIALDSVPLIAGTVIVAPLQLWILLLVGFAKAWRSMALALGIVLATIMVPTAIWGWAAGALAIGVVMIVTRLPQITDLIVEPSVEGVSVSSWVIGCGNLGVWLIYYAAHHQVATVISMVMAITGNLVIIGLVEWRRRHGARAGVQA